MDELITWLNTPVVGPLDGLFSIAAFAIISCVSFAMLWGRWIHLNPAEWIGTLIIGLWCAMRIPAKINDLDTLAVNLFLHVGLLLVAAGAVWRRVRAVRWRKVHGMASNGMRALNAEEARQVYGRGKD